MTDILWLRRDLRLADHPALVQASEAGAVLPVFVRDPGLAGAGEPRRRRLEASLAALRDATDGALVVRSGDPSEVIAGLAAEVGAGAVHVSGEHTPYARRRDARVAARLHSQGVTMTSAGSPYAVPPGSLFTGAGTPYQVFTPFSRAWREHGWPPPATSSRPPRWERGVEGEEITEDPAGAGEEAAMDRWREFLDDGLADYDDNRNRPDLDATSRVSVPLRLGEIHPRTLLAEVAQHPDRDSDGARVFVTELAWREFYADVLWHRPDSAWADLKDGLAGMEYDSGGDVERLVESWRQGRTGFPLVDAGMRQLLGEGWMHNRVRMVTASFLAKDLHVWWPIGARHFLDHLLDGDVASNNHGWQWAAGTGTDASPYFRVFNPVTQGLRFDPGGDYVRRWVPELAHLAGKTAHEPWRHDEGYDHGYPERIVEHDEERKESLARYEHTKG